MKTHTWSAIEGAIRDILAQDRAHPMLIESFVQYARQVYDGATGMISRHDLQDVPILPDFETISETDRATGAAMLGRTVMIKLNGGLGTSMGLEKAKSLLPVRPGLSFLDIIARQVLRLRDRHGVGLPLLLMTSFNTDQDTLRALAAYPSLSAGQAGLPLTFRQNRVPKLMADTLMPAQSDTAPEKCWCPPGHGDLFTALITSGLLSQLIARGYEYAFISNSDNLGAVIDPAIPGLMHQRRISFLMEVADRTEADRKGGHLACRRGNGQFLLRESGQCPVDEQDDFQDVQRHRYFNTNNLWVNLPALQEKVSMEGRIPALALIVNRKTLDPRDSASPAVLQLETAMGSAIASFNGAAALRVPRTRFAPVKTTDDLLGLWSDAYELTDDMHMVLSKARTIPGPPNIKLDPSSYRKIDDFTARFPHGAPSLVKCRSLTVQGDHTFSGKEIFEGDAVVN